MTGKKTYDIILYCVSMDKQPLSRRKCLKSKGFRREGVAENATNLHKKRMI